MNRPPAVLIVDDEPDHRLLLAAALRDVLPDASIYEATDGTAAHRLIRDHAPDILLCDFRLHGTNGLSFLQTLRQQGMTTPFVLITDHGSEETARLAFLEGAADYVTKEEAFHHPSRFARKIHQVLERRRLEEERLHAELLLENFLENHPYAILICDQTGTVVRWNRALARTLGTRANLKQLRASYSPLHDRQLQELGVTTCLEQALRGDWVVIPPFPWDPTAAGFSGPPVILRGVAFALAPKDRSPPHLCLMVQDVTVEETARRERDEYGAILFGLLNASPAAIFFIDLNDQVRFANHCAQEFFGFSPSAAIGMSRPQLSERISDAIHPSTKWTHPVVSTESAPGHDADPLIELVHPQHRYLRRHSRPVTGPAGEPVGHIELYTDETDAVEKQRDLEEQNRELDAFASRLAHDLKTPLVSLKGFAELLERQYSTQMDERSRLYLQKLRSSAAILGEMVDGLRDLAHAGSPSATDAVANPLVVLRLVCENLTPLAAEHGVQVNLPEHCPAVQCDRAKLFQIFQNLLANAIRYCDARRPLRYVAVEASGNGTEVSMRVSDNGLGMSAANLENAFEPFWRGHSAGDGGGMGLGLAITRRLVQAARGHITVESIPDEGTTFTVVLPQAEDGSAGDRSGQSEPF